MSDYIKREDAIRQIVKTSAQNELDIPAIGTVIYILSEMDAADVVEVVRCKDCKYHAEFSSKCNKLNLTPMLPSDYCSYGERAES